MSITQNKKRAKADYDMTYEAGRKAEREAFWSAFLQDGNRTDFLMTGVFSGYSWDFNNFYPTQDLIIRGDAYRLFYAWNTRAAHYGSLLERLNECGVKINTAGATRMAGAFGYSRMSEIPTIDLTSSTSNDGIFGESKDLKKIEKIIVVESTPYKNCFNNNISLEEIRIEGTIGQNGFDIHWSTNLSKASIYSVIYALATNPDSTVTNPTITLSKAAVDKAFEMPSGANNGSTSLEWAVLSEERGAWTKALA